MSDDLRRLFREVWTDMEQSRTRRMIEAAKRDPEKHAKTQAYDREIRYRYFRAGKLPDGTTVDYCWATVPNAAGFFLSWEERTSRDTGKRGRYLAFRKRKGAKAQALWRYERWREEHQS